MGSLEGAGPQPKPPQERIETQALATRRTHVGGAKVSTRSKLRSTGLSLLDTSAVLMACLHSSDPKGLGGLRRTAHVLNRNPQTLDFHQKSRGPRPPAASAKASKPPPNGRPSRRHSLRRCRHGRRPLQMLQQTLTPEAP